MLEVDAEISFADIGPEFLNHYRLIEPFGQKNPEPLFIARRVQPKLPGRVMREKHLRLLLRQDGVTQEARWFNAPINDLPPAPWDIVMRLQRNFWRGQERWQINLESVRTSE